MGNGEFKPDASITREQMAVILYNYIKYKGFALDTAASGAGFTDSPQISSWAREAVTAIQKTGVITGRPGGVFDPRGIATRGEVATIFSKFVEAVSNIE